MTKHECAVVMAYTGSCTLAGKDLNYFYAYASELLGRDVYSHEMPDLADELKEKSKIDFIRICQSASETQQAHWIPISENTAKCSVCGGWLKTVGKDHTGTACIFYGTYCYCPHCGEKIEKRRNDNGNNQTG